MNSTYKEYDMIEIFSAVINNLMDNVILMYCENPLIKNNFLKNITGTISFPKFGALQKIVTVKLNRIESNYLISQTLYLK